MSKHLISSSSQFVQQISLSKSLKPIADKVFEGIRISPADAELLYNEAELGFLGVLATYVAERINGKFALFNRNFHIEPTNICIHNCSFCSYRRNEGEDGAWISSLDEIKEQVKRSKNKQATEVHITGGVHPQWDIDYYCQMVRAIKSVNTDLHVKAFSAVELDYAISKSGLTLREGIRELKRCGLDSIPGGGAEIADSELRKIICGSKTSWSRWLEIHEAVHSEGLTSNATMLYGHMESYAHRVEHMNGIRELQDKTGGFNCFIPLKFKSLNNSMSQIGEVSTLEDMKNFAVARIFLDNIPHLKAYWPMLGKSAAKLALGFGVDDLDGTIDDSTKIYSMAGAEDQSPSMTIDEICSTIRSVGKTPVERDSLYNHLKTY
mgnify:FL=1